MQTIESRLKELKVVPVVTIKDAGKAKQLAQVLMENDLPCAEITIRTQDAAKSIRLMRNAYPEMLIGAGTVLTTAQVDLAISAGADFIVSPGLNPETINYCLAKKMPIIPGINNPSLVEQALSLGLKTVKFFPAEASGGIAMLKALSAVYPVLFMPTGGITPNNINEYCAMDKVLTCGGSWMVPEELIDNSDWSAIAQLIRESH